jgi:hypothetical protein
VVRIGWLIHATRCYMVATCWPRALLVWLGAVFGQGWGSALAQGCVNPWLCWPMGRVGPGWCWPRAVLALAWDVLAQRCVGPELCLPRAVLAKGCAQACVGSGLCGPRAVLVQRRLAPGLCWAMAVLFRTLLAWGCVGHGLCWPRSALPNAFWVQCCWRGAALTQACVGPGVVLAQMGVGRGLAGSVLALRCVGPWVCLPRAVLAKSCAQGCIGKGLCWPAALLAHGRPLGYVRPGLCWQWHQFTKYCERETIFDPRIKSVFY